MLTIGQLADFAGVTVRTVRHYHQRGLLPEPDRDVSGYRRYGPDAVVTLIRIRTLADAGVPLARVQELLSAGPDEFERAVAEIDRDLRVRVRALEAHRKQVRRLTSSDGLALPDDVVVYLDRLRALGLGERVVRIERDGWILLAAHAPDRVVPWIRMKHDALADAGYRDMYLALDAAFDWDVDDPRLVALADRLIADVRGVQATEQPWATPSDDVDAEVAGLLDSQTLDASPAWARLSRLIAERGVVGWTNARTRNVGSDAG